MLKISILGDKMNVTSPKMLAQAIRDARKQRNLTRRETAASMGMKQSTVSEFENHPEGTSLDTLFKLLAALDLKLQVVSWRGKKTLLMAGSRSGDLWKYEQKGHGAIRTEPPFSLAYHLDFQST